MKRLGPIFFAAFTFAACRHIPKADTAGVPPPWPPALAPIKNKPASPDGMSPPPAPSDEKKSDKPLTPPLKPDVVPPPQT